MTYLNKKTLIMTFAVSSVIGLAGCTTTNGGNNALQKGAIGAAGGAIAGAIIGNNAGDGDAQSGALIGAVVGGAGGAYMGCREDGGCGAQNNQYQRQGQYQQSGQYQQQAPAVNKRQFYDQRSGRYYYYDPARKAEYYENGERKY